MSADRVNEFDTDAWGSVFDAMTKEREESESAEAVSARQAAEMVTKMLEDMQDEAPVDRMFFIQAAVVAIGSFGFGLTTRKQPE